MSWKEKVSEWGGGEVSFLSEDGEAMIFITCGEPTLLESKYKGKVTQRIAIPLITPDGFTLLIMGKRFVRKLSKYESKFKDTGFIVVRHGEQRDVDTSYELTILNDSDQVDKLFNYKNSIFEPSMIDEALEAARDIMSG